MIEVLMVLVGGFFLFAMIGMGIFVVMFFVIRYLIRLGIAKYKEYTLTNQAKRIKDNDILQVCAIKDSFWTNKQERLAVSKSIESFGAEVTVQVSSKDRLMQSKNVDKYNNRVNVACNTINDLKKQIVRLNPVGIDFEKRGKILYLDKTIRYFKRYTKSHDHVSALMKDLSKHKETMLKDKNYLSEERLTLHEALQKVERNIENGQKAVKLIEGEVEEARAKGIDDYKIDFLEKEVLGVLLQKVQDFYKLQVVIQQGIAAIEMSLDNQRNIIRGIESLMAVTVVAWRTAAAVAYALYNQKIVLDSIFSEAEKEVIVSPEEFKEVYAGAIDVVNNLPEAENSKLVLAGSRMSMMSNNRQG